MGNRNKITGAMGIPVMEISIDMVLFAQRAGNGHSLLPCRTR